MPLRRTRSSRRDRNRKADDEAQQRLTGDAHWSKLLHVNASDEDMRLVRRLSSKRLKDSERDLKVSPYRRISREADRDTKVTPNRRISRDTEREPQLSPQRKVSKDVERELQVSAHRRISRDVGREPQISPDRRVSRDIVRESPVSTDRRVSRDIVREPPISTDRRVSRDIVREPPISTDRRVSRDIVRESPISTDRRVSRDIVREPPISTDRRISKDIGREPQLSPDRRISRDTGREPLVYQHRRISRDIEREPQISPDRRISRDIGREPDILSHRRISRDTGMAPQVTPYRKISRDIEREPLVSPNRRISRDTERDPRLSPNRKLSRDTQMDSTMFPLRKISGETETDPRLSPHRKVSRTGIDDGGGVSGGGGDNSIAELLESNEGTFINGSNAEGTCSVRVVNPRPRLGILSAVTTRIRNWLGSRRKYEISPRESFVGTTEQGKLGKDGQRKESMFEVDAVLNRCGPGHLSPLVPERLPNGYAAATAAVTGKIPLQKSPVSNRHAERMRKPSTTSRRESVLSILSQIIPTSSSNTPSKNSSGGGVSKNKNKSPVDIRIEVSDFSGRCPSPLSPSASRLLASSRRHLLRQSRSKLKEKGVLVTSLAPTGPGLNHQPLTTTISCPPQWQDVAAMGTDISQRRIHSWPLLRRKTFPEDDECPDSAKEEALTNAGLNGQESLEDCSIRFEDLELGECIKVGRRCKIYRARWHGDVFVHLFGELVKRPDREGFWRDVAKLCRIRHENINLFMGACTVTPHLAVITSSVTGKSLFEQIHMQRERMSLHTRVQILQGVAQGMGYLHAKGIVLRKLNTANIFLCPRVKVSAIDFSLPEARHNRKDYASIPRGHLTYVAPELLRTIRVIPPRLVSSVDPSPESDVFAFGTIMYEVLGGAFPYPGFPPESVIWSVCTGHRQNLANINCTIPLKTLIEDCWSHEPLYRPDFSEISKELHRNSPQYKRHSSSEPERLNRSPGALD